MKRRESENIPDFQKKSVTRNPTFGQLNLNVFSGEDQEKFFNQNDQEMPNPGKYFF